MDVYLPGPGNQIHDLNPNTFPPVGLFWTVEIPVAGVDVHLGKGSVSLQASNLAVLDYGNVPNALFGGFAGKFVRNHAQMEWRAVVRDFPFVSDPIATSTSSFAELGRERNGSFFP